MPDTSILIGVDGGGTGCRVAVGTRAEGIRAQAEGGAANVTTDFDLAIRNLLSTIDTACRRAGIDDLSAGVRLHLGLAGVLSEKDASRVAAALPFAQVTVTDDCTTALAGALGGRDGYLVSAGTGSFVAARKNGVASSVGGWGFQISDQGSGAWLGRNALESVLLCHDGLKEHSPLTHALLESFSCDPARLVHFAKTAGAGDFAALAPQIVNAAKAGDAIAAPLMKRGADYLQNALTRSGFTSGNRLCFTGGIGPHYADHFPSEMLTNRVTPKGTPLDGAFFLAANC
ncbi:BadF/BadG/BcrA/BcrD ATPase family protein [Marivita sp. GX14005]|uniref:BadF/BadG/BcrA/BcrD ATPase family protein n=1 Tax=Marivita sp. GX14005 TaxID=2942276 RepID=UPI002019B953|nr:BadF/BadG/BcrA/BcrD ATPase family protein [Marivita sp. GX14005]MCL3880910.1 ATPase [Marivita sp. GX14005]